MSSHHLASQAVKTPIVRWSAALLWSATATYLMVWSSRDTPVRWLSRLFGGTQLTDAIGHMVLCGILVWLWYRALRGSLQPASALGVVVAIGLGLSVVTELAQVFVPSRGASLLDLLANVLGVGLSAGVIGAAKRPGDGELTMAK